MERTCLHATTRQYPLRKAAFTDSFKISASGSRFHFCLGVVRLEGDEAFVGRVQELVCHCGLVSDMSCFSSVCVLWDAIGRLRFKSELKSSPVVVYTKVLRY